MARELKPRIKYNCEVCKKDCCQKESEYKRSLHHFCGRECSLKYLIISGKQRKPEGKCFVCKDPISKSRKYCKECSPKKRIFTNKTYRSKTSTGTPCSLYECLKCKTLISHKNGVCKTCFLQGVESVNKTLTIKECSYSQDANKYNFIRSHAAKMIKAYGVERKCCNCNYCTFTEVCHIKPIKSFPPEATLNEVNSIDNLIILCPNCHTEFDKLPEKRKEILEKLNARVPPPV